MREGWLRLKNEISLKLKVLSWKVSGASSHEIYEKIQKAGSVKSREDENTQREILKALQTFYHWAPDKALKILDAGCGDGWTLDQMKAQGYRHLFGVDISEEKLKTAREIGGHDVRKAIMPDLPFEDESMDFVFNRYVLEHILFPQKTIESFYRVLKPGGIFFLIVPKTNVRSGKSEAHVNNIRSLGQLRKWFQSAGFKVLTAELCKNNEEEFWIVAKKEALVRDPGIRAKTVKSIGVVGMLQALRGAVGFVVTILLYRLLMAEDFGLFAMCEAYLAFFLILADMGIESVVIQKPGRDTGEILQSGFVLRVVFGVVIFLLILFGAPWLGLIARSGELANPMRMVGLTLLLNLIVFKPSVALQKNIQFGKMVVPEIVTVFSSAAISLTLALMGYGYWSLIWASVISQALRGLCFVVLYPQPLFEPWKKSLAINLLSLGRFSFFYSFLAFFLSKMMHLVVGRVFGIAALGFYYLAFNWANLFVTRVFQLVGQVVFPAFAKIESERGRVTKIYYEYLEHIVSLAAPFAVFMAVVSPVLIPGILGAKWEPAVFLCQILCLHGFFRALAGAGLNVFLSLGHFKKLTQCLLIECGVILILIYPVIKVIGIIGVAYVVGFAKVVCFVWISVVLNRMLEDRLRRVLEQILPSVISACLMGGLLWLCREMLAETFWHPLIQLIILTISSLVFYAAFFTAIFPARRKRLFSLWNDLWMRLTLKTRVPAAQEESSREG